MIKCECGHPRADHSFDGECLNGKPGMGGVRACPCEAWMVVTDMDEETNVWLYDNLSDLASEVANGVEYEHIAARMVEIQAQLWTRRHSARYGGE